MQILPMGLTPAGSSPGSFVPVPQAGTTGPLFSSILNMSAESYAPSVWGDSAQTPFADANSSSQPLNNVSLRTVNAANSQVPVPSRNLDEMRQVKVSQEDFSRMRDKLSQNGVSKDTLDQLQDKMNDSRGLTWGELVYSIQKDVMGKYLPQNSLSRSDKLSLQQFFTQVGFDSKQAGQLLTTLQNGNSSKVLGAVAKKLSDLSPDQTVAISADQISALGKAMNLPSKVQDKLGDLLGQTGMADLSGDQIKQAMHLVKQASENQGQQASKTLDSLRSVVEPQMAQARQHIETVRNSDNLSTASTERNTKLRAAQGAPAVSTTKTGKDSQAQQVKAEEQNELREHGPNSGSTANGNQEGGQQAKGRGHDSDSAQDKAWADFLGKVRLASDSQINPSGAGTQGQTQPGQANSAGQSLVQAHQPGPAFTASSPMVEQVQSALMRNMGQGTSQLTLSLTPESLGTLNVVLTVKGKDVQALIKAETPEASQTISEHLSQIKQSLEDKGLTVSKMEVSTNLPQDSSLGQQWSGTDQHNQAKERQESLGRMRASALLAQDGSLAQEMQSSGVQENISRGGLNVIA